MTSDYGNLELHQILLSAMQDFHNFCEANNLRYCLHGGTCLGAIRHQGFIPWDDDVDIAMPRKDYDRFLKLAPKTLGNKYTVLTYKNDKSMITNVTKIKIHTPGKEWSGDTYPFLDIFPMSDVPNSKWLQRLQNKLAIFVNTIVYTRIGYVHLNSFKAKLVYGSLSKLGRRFWSGVLEHLVIKHFPHFRSKSVNIVATANYCNNTGYATDLWPKYFFENRLLTPFEGEMFYITQHWEEYLTEMYGDYMTPPAENARSNKHGIEKG